MPDTTPHLTMGIAGIASQRVQLAPVVHEPLLYVERVSLKRWQLLAKRAVDVILASIGLLIAAPAHPRFCVVVKIQDRGPVFFKQERVGLQGDAFVLWEAAHYGRRRRRAPARSAGRKRAQWSSAEDRSRPAGHDVWPHPSFHEHR